MQTLDITLQAGAMQAFDIGGSYFEIIEGLGAVDINFENSDGSRAGDLEMLNALPGYWVQGPFSRFELRNRYPLQQTVRVMYGRGVGGSRRVQGVVQTVDGGQARTMDAQAFMAPCAVSTVAGQHPHAQLWNPAGSGRLAVVKALHISSTVAGGLLVRSAPAIFGAFFGALRRKYVGAAAIASLEMRSGHNAAIQGDAMAQIFVSAGQLVTFRLDDPIIVPPGGGLFVVHANQGTDLLCTLEGFLA